MAMEILLVSTCGLVANHYMQLRKTGGELVTDSDENFVSDNDLLGSPDPNITVDDTTPVSEPAPLGVRTLKTDNASTPGYDQERYESQFFPEDPNPQITDKPWMRMVNAPYKHKEEVLEDDPTPQDVMGTKMFKKARNIERRAAEMTVPISSEKQHDRPVEQIATDNGSNRGFHIGSGQKYHRFVFSDQPVIEIQEGPRGSFAGGGKSGVAGLYKTTTQRSSLKHDYVGPPVAIGVPQSIAPIPSFDITASHMESWKLDDHIEANSRGPVARRALVTKNSVDTSHDENLQVLDNSLVRRGERFGTGASGNRDLKIHVPLNLDTRIKLDDRVAPNFKIGKMSDKTDQEVRIRNKIIPEISQNVSALRKNSRPPVTGGTDFKESGIDTSSVTVGTSSRGLSLQAVNTPSDAFTTTERKEVMGEAVSKVMKGMSTSHMVPGMKSGDSQFRTTNSLSETVSTPFIRGSGGKNVPVVQPLHAEPDTSLSEIGSFYGRSGANLSKKPINTGSIKEFNDKRDNISSGSVRQTMLPSRDRSLPKGLSQNPTGSVLASKMSVSLKKDDGIDMVKDNKNLKGVLSNKLGGKSTTTKNRRMGEVLNSRLGTSPALKKLLGNPYSSPAASRMSTT